MARWLQLDGKIINLDQVAYVSPHKIKVSPDEPPVQDGAQFSFVNPDCWLNTKKSVEEVYRLIEAVEGPEPPKARITDHFFIPTLGSVYECFKCTRPKEAHAR